MHLLNHEISTLQKKIPFTVFLVLMVVVRFVRFGRIKRAHKPVRKCLRSTTKKRLRLVACFKALRLRGLEEAWKRSGPIPSSIWWLSSIFLTRNFSWETVDLFSIVLNMRIIIIKEKLNNLHLVLFCGRQKKKEDDKNIFISKLITENIIQTNRCYSKIQKRLVFYIPACVFYVDDYVSLKPLILMRTLAGRILKILPSKQLNVQKPIK